MQNRTQLYLDHAAATPMRAVCRDVMAPFETELCGNASSPYAVSRRARAALDRAREQVAALIGAHPDEIVWTSGGTEADNWALWGVALSNFERRGHIVVSAIEHHAVLEPAQALGDLGFDVAEARANANGEVTARAVSEVIRPDTRLVSLMLCNNETGVLQPVAEVARALRSWDLGLGPLERTVQDQSPKPKILLHSDATQAAGRLPIDVDELGVDLLTLSAHKIGGPKGVGALYIRRGTKMLPFFRGGAQERGRRAGTENVPGIVGFGVAAEEASAELETESARLTNLRDELERGLQELGGNINGHGVRRAPHISNVTLPNRRAETLALNLDLRGVAVGTGSACASGALEPSHVLLAMGHSPESARASLRFSLGRTTPPDEVTSVLRILKEVLNHK